MLIPLILGVVGWQIKLSVYHCTYCLVQPTCLQRSVLFVDAPSKYFSDLQQVGGFLWVLLFPPPVKLTATI